MDLTIFGPASTNLAVVVVLVGAARAAHRYADAPYRTALAVMALLALCTLLGGRALFIANHPGAYAGRWYEALMLWKGGFHLPGGIVTLILVAPTVCRRFGLSPGRFGDAITPAIVVGIAITRLGCTIAGCCTGEICTAPWCVAFPAGTLIHLSQQRLGLIPEGAPWSQPVLPLQLAFLAIASVLTAFSMWLRRHKAYDGQVALAVMFLFAATTALLEPFRARVPLEVSWGPLPKLAWEVLAVAGFAGLALVVAEVRYRRSGRRRVAATLA